MSADPSSPQTAKCVSRWLAALLIVPIVGCHSPESLVTETDRNAYEAIADVRRGLLDDAEGFTIDDPAESLRKRLMEEQNLAFRSPVSFTSQTPEFAKSKEGATGQSGEVTVAPEEPLVLRLVDALQVAAANSRDYQSRKENVFRSALALDLRRYDFSTRWGAFTRISGRSDGSGGSEQRSYGADADVGADRKFANGALLSAGFTLNFLKMLSGGGSTLGVGADTSVTIPLIRGAGKDIAREPLTQAERNLFYEACSYERYKHVFAVEISAQYLEVLRQFDAVRNADENYKRLQESVQRSAAAAEAGRLPAVQVDQARQDELRARAGWIQARQNFDNSLDRFKVTLGLPPDARLNLDPGELDRLFDSGTMPDPAVPAEEGSPWLDERRAVDFALAHRLDLRVSLDRVDDERRQIAIAVDRLRPEVTLGGSARWSASGDSSELSRTLDALRSDRGVYAGFLTIDPGFDRTLERIGLRNELMDLRQAVRRYQENEDQVKLDIRRAIRALESARERLLIQRNSIELAERRVDSTELFLQAGRAQVRDLLDARSDLLEAKNGFTSAQVSYRIAFLELQRDLGVLEVGENGIWTERNHLDLLSDTHERDSTGHES